MKLNAKQFAQALHEAVSQTKASEHDKILNRFAKVLAQEGALGLWPDIEKEFLNLAGKAEGKEQAELTTARSVQVSASLVETLNQAAHKKLEIEKQVDESLIGGVILKTDDVIFDASVKTQLSKLKSELSK
ncbi:MAG: ATP synthase F1 subunit delta [Patescibacteria group bacterium]|nr:ATP synthase F1 subunit delta [Patescibacteria group bacterium]